MKENKYTLDPRARMVFETSGSNHFFGYHDVSPWSRDGRYLVCLETNLVSEPPLGPDPFGKRDGDAAGICVIDRESGYKLVRIAETRAWNFQQGARLQWISDREIIYNDRKKDDHGWDKFVSIIFDVNTDANTKEKKKTLEYPIYAVSPNEPFGLGLDFLSLGGGYGYAIATVDSGSTSGIVRVDFNKGETKPFLSLESIVDKIDEDNARSLERPMGVTQIIFNPSGKRICFMFKTRLPDGGFQQRLITANPDGGDLYVLPGHVTHFCWRNDTEILAFGKYSPSLMKLRKIGLFQNPPLKFLLNLIRKMRGALKQKIAGQSYFLLKDKTQEVERVAVGVMTEDGHPQFSPNGEWVVTDTYADKNHERRLILYNWKKRKKIEVGRFYSLPDGATASWEDSEMRSDLHPRWNHDGTKICIDSVHTGSRQMHIIDVSGITKIDQV